MMLSETGNEPHSLQRLSAVMDGEADEVDLREVCGAWQSQPSCRATWHAYHLIGDVLRSDDLASDAGRGAALLAAVRGRLAEEPVHLIPQARRTARWRALAPAAAIAAGFVVVGGALLVLQSPPPLPDSSLAQATASRALRAADDEASGAMPALVQGGPMIRDPRLQQYLIAHKQFGGSTALGLPSGFLRSATVDVPAR